MSDEMNTGAGKPKKKKSGLNPTQKWLVAICVVLVLAIAGVLAFRTLFVEPELPDVDKKPPAFAEPSGDGGKEELPEELQYEDGVVPKTGGERKSAN